MKSFVEQISTIMNTTASILENSLLLKIVYLFNHKLPILQKEVYPP